jgi:hypothetical protein
VVGLPAGTAVEVQTPGGRRTLVASREGIVAFHDPAIGTHAVGITAASAR